MIRAVALIAVAIGLLQGGCSKGDRRGGKPASALPDPNVERFKIPIGNAPVRGPEHAKVTIIEWGDFDCPSTAAVEKVLARVAARYGNDVRLVWKNLPLPSHQAAMPEATIAMTVYAKKGNEAFWKLHDALLRRYRPPDREALEKRGERGEAERDGDDGEEYDRAALEKDARQVGLDDRDIEPALAGKHDPRVDADVAQAHTIGIFGTPTFFINGRPSAGAQPFDAFEKLVDEELALATKTMQSGVDPANVYDVVTRNGKQATVVPPASRPNQ